MLEAFKLDLEFAADIRNIAENTKTMSQSLAVIAGIMAKRDGIAFANPNEPPQHTEIHPGRSDSAPAVSARQGISEEDPEIVDTPWD